MSYPEEEVLGRPKLSLQPRGSDQSAVLTVKTSRPNPFGTARPREQVIAEREGKKETEVLKEQAQKEWKPCIVLTEAQREEKKAAEAELAFAKIELMKEFDPVKSKALKEEVANMEKKLDELLGTFERMAVQTAQTGGARRNYDRRRDDERGPVAATSLCASYGGDALDNYSNFSRGRDRDVGSYGDNWGAKGGSTSGCGGRSNSSQCFNCGEMGHFSRECPTAGGSGGPGRGNHASNYGGVGRSSNRQCYTCGQEGHFSRECPQSYGFRGSGFTDSYIGTYGGSYSNSSRDFEAGSYAKGGSSYSGGGGYDDRYRHGDLHGRGGYPSGYGK